MPFSSIWNLVTFLPSLAMGVRRLHDTDRSGWWWLLGFIPLIGIIVLIVFWCFGEYAIRTYSGLIHWARRARRS